MQASLEGSGIAALTGTQSADSTQNTQEHKAQLRALNRQLIGKFIELLDKLVRTPDDSNPIVDEIKTIVLNMHHVINLHRPHQARDALVQLMRLQCEHAHALIDHSTLYVRLNASLERFA
jgi:mediator of RNA polymerase II transcription subunit 7